MSPMFTTLYNTGNHSNSNSNNMRTGYAGRAARRAANRKGDGSTVKKIDYPHPKGLELCFKVVYKNIAY